MRLSKRSDFHRVRTQGTAFPGKLIVLSVLPIPSTEMPDGVPFKFAVILTRKIGNAVARNRIRRHLRAVLSEFGPKIIPGHYLVMIGRFRAPGTDYQSMRKDWKNLALKAEILHDIVPSDTGRPQT
jgi:ribonuclease P protein component